LPVSLVTALACGLNHNNVNSHQSQSRDMTIKDIPYEGKARSPTCNVKRRASRALAAAIRHGYALALAHRELPIRQIYSQRDVPMPVCRKSRSARADAKVEFGIIGLPGFDSGAIGI